MRRYSNMDLDVKKRWVEDLRSGQYQQGFGSLCQVSTTTGAVTFCCLGVLARSCGCSERSLYSTTILPQFVKDESRISTGTISELISLNDHRNRSFSAIADWIEEHL